MPQFSGPGSVRYWASMKGFSSSTSILSIGVRVAAAEPFVFDRGVLIDPFVAGVVNADDDQRLNGAGLDQRIRGFAHAPVVSLDKRGLGIEQVLAILHIKHGKAALPLGLVTWREIDEQIVVLLHQPGNKLFVLVQTRGEGARSWRLGVGQDGFRRHSAMASRIAVL